MIVKYSKKFPYAPWLNYDVGFEEDFVNLTSDDEAGVLAALKKLDAIAVKHHKDNNPQLTDDDGKVTIGHEPFSTTLKSIDRRSIDELEIKIDNATSEKELWELVSTNREDIVKYGLQSVFDTKLNELKNQ